jgi:glycosyltransferase involved in cell wall biosynthesis
VRDYACAALNLDGLCVKVLFFIRSMVVGGSQRQVAMLARGLIEHGHEAAIVVFYTGGEIDVARESLPQVISLGKSGRWDVITPLARLRRVLRTERPDVVYAFHPPQAVLATLLLPRAGKTRLVYGVRAAAMEVERYDSLSALTYALEVRLSKRADLIIANGHTVRADAIERGMPGSRIAVIPNGIDTQMMHPDPAAGSLQRRAWGIPETAFVIGCVARFDPMKDHRTFLEAAARFAREQTDTRFVCVGDGAARYREELKAQARFLGLDGALIWAGEMDSLRNAYNAFDVATLSSAFGEGFPNVVGEAMACGIPVVATDVGDVRRIVGDLGEVVPPRNPQALACGWARMRQLLMQKSVARAQVRQSIVMNYSLDSMVHRSIDSLSQLVAGRSGEEIAREFGAQLA